MIYFWFLPLLVLLLIFVVVLYFAVRKTPPRE
jgi:hypothetical protein